MKNLDSIFRPRSIAVIGASSKRHTIGREILHNMINYEFNGKIFPVNPKAGVIHSIKAYSTVLDVPDSVDLAIIAVRKELVAHVAEQCGEKGVGGLVVISAGFREVGPAGLKLEEELMDVVRKYNMRMVGPNCFGVVNTDPDIRLNATFGKARPKPGNVSFISQSGGLGEAILNFAEQLNLGFSMFCSVGNKADISSNDLMEYWRNDEKTRMILMYLENFGNPVRFTKIARETSRIKPIVAVKAGRTSQGAVAASSHTGALAGADVGVDALFSQCGVMRTSSIEELYDVAMALSKQSVPKGNRCVIITNAGGPAILATDALISQGMKLPPLPKKIKNELSKFLPEEVSLNNPLDLVAGAGSREFTLALEAVCKDKTYDTIIPIFVQPITIDEIEVAQSIINAKKNSDKPFFVCFMGVGFRSAGIEMLQENGIPVFIFPEAIAKVLRTLDGYRQFKQRKKGKFPTFKVERKVVEEIIKSSQSKKVDAIIGDDAMAILEAYGIPVSHYTIAETPKTAVEAARKVGYPVVMKLNTPQILHKTEAKAVRVDIRSDKELRLEYNNLKKQIGKVKKGEKFSVAIQKMVTGGIETVIGMTHDPAFGPLIMFGLGGIYVEVMKDVSFRVTPLSDEGADQMIKSLKSYPLLTGFRGSDPVDTDLIKDSLLRLSQLITDFPELAEIDINPFIVSGKKNCCKAVDARFILQK
ncbi:MAG: acetate--CoA ligase family protein [candidate division Zixibacteria bacterium]|nr:acetate--CoA ligase family protein [candidate division Zixibacteria bacterium]